MMKFRILVVAISLLFYLGEVSSVDNEVTLAGEDLTTWENFKSINLDETKDCNSTGTKIAVEWLQQKTSTTDKDGNPIEEVIQAKRWTDLVKLRKFLASKNFVANPGSLQFFNWQDKKLNLDCGKSGKWSVVVPNDGYKKYAAEIAKHTSQRTLSIEATEPQVYFRIFKCESTECTHFIYGLNRPLPYIDFPLYWMESDKNVHIGCHVHPCIKSNVKGDICKFALSPEPNKENEPFTFGWTIPADAPQPTDKGRILYLSEENPKSIPLDIMISAKTEKSKYESHLKVKDIEAKHEGLYECVMQDTNGVVSTFEPGSFPLHDTYKGIGRVHVRGHASLYIALGLCVGLLVLTVLMNYLLPSKAEFDDESSNTEKKEA